MGAYIVKKKRNQREKATAIAKIRPNAMSPEQKYPLPILLRLPNATQF
jgi:hypothetical protein